MRYVPLILLLAFAGCSQGVACPELPVVREGMYAVQRPLNAAHVALLTDAVALGAAADQATTRPADPAVTDQLRTAIHNASRTSADLATVNGAVKQIDGLVSESRSHDTSRPSN